MQIDGHHGATYVAARAAGFAHTEAEKIAYAAQYVDDATNEGIIQFEGSAYMYARIASAHKMIDYNNFAEVKNHLAWLPFHFLPGNGKLPKGQEPAGGETDKLVCKPDSHVARDMLRFAMSDRGTDRELHRLGIAMHVYADTFAHQGFVGALSEANQTKNPKSGNPEMDKKIQAATRKELFGKVRRDPLGAFLLFIAAVKVMVVEHKSPVKFVRDFLKGEPLGHAGADTYPDQPYLVWEYDDWKGVRIQRDNPATFMQAINMLVQAMRAWRAGDTSMNLGAHDGLNAADAKSAEKLFRELQYPDGDVRHARWMEAIASGEFSFGRENLQYVPKGVGSWKYKALGTDKATDTGLEFFPYTPAFLKSDWKLFHDALQAHRSDVVHEILPQYGICAA